MFIHLLVISLLLECKSSGRWVFVLFTALSPLSRKILQFSCLVVSNSLQPHGTAACQASLSITNFQSLLKLMSIESVRPSSHLIFCRPLPLLPLIPPSIGVFQMSQFFASGGQSIGISASASVLPMNIQD